MNAVRPSALQDCSLRERKRARLRVGLWNELRDRIETRAFADISIRELAAAVEISEPTFFAHFTSKTDLLSYHIGLWRIGTVLAASVADDGAEFLYRFFDRTAESILEGPRLWFEITGEVARGQGLCSAIEISVAERLLVFEDPAALPVAITPQGELFEHHLEIAGHQGRLLGSLPDAVNGLLANFYGTPLALGRAGLDDLGNAYRSHLSRFVSSGPRT